MSEEVLDHSVLGRLVYDDSVNWWESHVDLAAGRRIDLCLSTDTFGGPKADLQELLGRGVDYLDWLRRMELDCRIAGGAWQMNCSTVTTIIGPRRKKTALAS